MIIAILTHAYSSIHYLHNRYKQSSRRMTNKSEKPLYGDIITRLPCYKASEGKAMVFILERQLPGNYTTVNSEIDSKN